MPELYASDKPLIFIFLSPPNCPEGAAVLVGTLSDKYVFITFHTPEPFRWHFCGFTLQN